MVARGIFCFRLEKSVKKVAFANRAQNRKYLCAIGNTVAGSHVSS